MLHGLLRGAAHTQGRAQAGDLRVRQAEALPMSGCEAQHVHVKSLECCLRESAIRAPVPRSAEVDMISDRALVCQALNAPTRAFVFLPVRIAQQPPRYDAALRSL
jgi:hypothetical protein